SFSSTFQFAPECWHIAMPKKMWEESISSLQPTFGAAAAAAAAFATPPPNAPELLRYLHFRRNFLAWYIPTHGVLAERHF
ncbi:MAG: hypothetical protein AAF709_25700, partial [Pseudomonadota bacterium]